MKSTATLISIISLMCFSCTNHDKNLVNSTKNNPDTLANTVKLVSLKKDTLTNNQVDSLIYEIRSNFNQINKITKWSKIEKGFLEGTNEGGEATFFYLNGRLIKITTDQMGETFRLVREYYLTNTELFFVFEKLEKYKEPFDRSNSKFYESRKYFQNNKIIKRVNTDIKENPLNETSIADDQTEILNELKKLKSHKQTSL